MGNAAGATRERERDSVHSCFSLPAGRWMVFSNGCLGARARYRETSELSGPRWRSPRPPRPGSHIKSGLGEGGSSGADDGGAPRGPRPAVAPRFGKRTRELPVGTMRCRELPLVLLALVLCQAPRAPAAPVRAAGETALAKMYPRGNHWAVGECRRARAPGRTRQRWGPSPLSRRFWVLALGGWVCSDLSPQTPHPSPSWPAGSHGLAPGSSRFPRHPSQRAALKAPTPREDPLPCTPTQHPLSRHRLSPNTFRKPGPRERLGPLVQPGVSRCAPQSRRWGTLNLFSEQCLNLAFVALPNFLSPPASAAIVFSLPSPPAFQPEACARVIAPALHADPEPRFPPPPGPRRPHPLPLAPSFPSAALGWPWRFAPPGPREAGSSSETLRSPNVTLGISARQTASGKCKAPNFLRNHKANYSNPNISWGGGGGWSSLMRFKGGGEEVLVVMMVVGWCW